MALPSRLPASTLGTTRQSAFPATPLWIPLALSGRVEQGIIERQRTEDLRVAELTGQAHLGQSMSVYRGRNRLGNHFNCAHHGNLWAVVSQAVQHLDGVENDLFFLLEGGRNIEPTVR